MPVPENRRPPSSGMIPPVPRVIRDFIAFIFIAAAQVLDMLAAWISPELFGPEHEERR